MAKFLRCSNQDEGKTTKIHISIFLVLNFSKTSNGFQSEPSDEDDRAEFRRRRAGGDRLRTGDRERRAGLRRRPPAPPPRRGERDLFLMRSPRDGLTAVTITSCPSS